jgi:integrase
MATNLLSHKDCQHATSDGKAVRKLHDGGGLYLWVLADGAKYWRMRWQVGQKQKGLAVGVFPKISLADARKVRDRVHKQLADGLDPSAEKQAAKRAKKLAAVNSFEAVAREWFGKQVPTWAASHATDVKRRLEADLFPTLGERPIAAIDAPELLAAVRKIEARGAHDLSHRVLGVAGQVLRYGIATGRCTRDWSADLKGALQPADRQHQPAVTPKGLPDLLRKIATYDNDAMGGERQTRLALQLLALTFTRTTELIAAEWTEFDLEHGLWAIPAERMKGSLEHLVPLSKQALVILAELKVISAGSRYVLPGRSADKPISNNTLLFALYRLGYKGQMTGHGFRAVASTVLNESGLFDPDVIERQLAHVERNKVKGAYNRALYLPQRIKMMAWWADHLDSLTADNVVVLPKSA